MGRTIRCPRCKYENLAIDIWCERCGTPVDWQGTASVPSVQANGHKGTGRNGNGHHGGLAALAGGLPWLKSKSSQPAVKDRTVESVSAPVSDTSPPPQPSPQGGGRTEGGPPPPPPAPPVAAAPPPPAPVTAAAPEVEVPASPPPQASAQGGGRAEGLTRVFCPGCGQSNEVTNKFCPRCGHAIAAASAAGMAAAVASKRPAPRVARTRKPRKPRKLPQLRIPALHIPRMTMPVMHTPRLHLPRIPMVAWAIAAVVLVLLIAPLAYVLSPSARHLSAARTSPPPALTKTGTPAAGQASAVAAAIPGVEAKTGLKYSSGACPTNTACLRLAGQTTGLNAAAVQFSTAGTGGRQCAGYVYQDSGYWHFVDATCGLPGQLSPLVGSQATVHVPGQCANVRDAASLQGGVVACLNDGTSVRVDGGPNFADGKLWWHLEKNGWMAHEFLVSA